MDTLEVSNNLKLYFGYFCEFSAEALTVILSTSERQKAKSFRQNDDQNRFIITRAVLKLFLSRYTGESVKAIEFNYGVNGKPYITGKVEIQFNHSHSGSAFLIGFTDSVEIGVDIEKIHRTINFSKITPLLYSENELEAFRSLKERDKHNSFLKSWTCKEAFLKAKGSGLTFPLNQLELSFLEHEEVKIINTRWDSMEKENWNLRSFKLSNKYRCAIAVNGPINIISLNKVSGIAFFDKFFKLHLSFMISILHVLDERIKEHPEKLLYVFLNIKGEIMESYTYEEFFHRTNDIASHINSYKLNTGDRVLLAYPPGLEIVCAFFACVRLGLIPVPVYPPTAKDFDISAQKMNFIAKDCDAAAVLTDRTYYWSVTLNFAKAGIDNPSNDSDCISKLKWIISDDSSTSGIQNFKENHSKILFLQYTSGSTNNPKGCNGYPQKYVG